jgi:hypothetical protein
MLFLRRLHSQTLRACVAAALMIACISSTASAGPPAYLILRRPESPAKHNGPGYSDVAPYDARTSGYAYGWFGAPPRSHASRHFGYYRVWTQWTTW